MLANQLLLLITILLFGTFCDALKGATQRNLRSLQTAGEKDGTSKSPIDVTDGPDKKEDKKDKDKKKEKKEKKDKKEKCKKRPKEGDKDKDHKDKSDKGKKSSKGPSSDNTTETEGPILDPPEIFNETSKEDRLLWCEDPSIKVMGDCSMLEERSFPDESTVVGIVELELTPEEKGVVQKVDEILQNKISLSAMGCSTGRRLEGNETTDENSTVFLFGFEIGNATKSKSKCVNSNMSQSDCDVITSPVIVHYSGNASDDQKVAMFDKLTNALWTQVDDGDFDSVASVHYAEARLAEGDESYNSKGSGPSVAMIGGIVVAVAVLALAVAGYVFYKRRGADSSGNRLASVAPANEKPFA